MQKKQHKLEGAISDGLVDAANATRDTSRKQAKPSKPNWPFPIRGAGGSVGREAGDEKAVAAALGKTAESTSIRRHDLQTLVKKSRWGHS